MAQRDKIRKRIGLIFSYSESWIAGAYYILNLIESLHTLPEEEKPEICVFSGKEEDFEVVKKTAYPFLKFKILRGGYYSYEYTFFQRLLNKISLKLTKKQVFDKRPKNDDLEICFPNPEGYYFEHLHSNKKIYWIPDFQEHHLPSFFSENEIISRKALQENLVKQNKKIVFSSQDAQKDFFQFYPDAKNKTFVLNFAVSHPNYQHLAIESLLNKFQLPQTFFFSPNQFWAHKNQIVILKALKVLKDKGIPCFVAFSGKEQDYRNPDYFKNLQNYVSENKLSDCVAFLGFIDREEQLQLMKNAISVIQPSLFEGWSTVVEDCKAMNQFVVLSNLNVHQEQLKKNVLFFNPLDENDLAEKLSLILNNKPEILHEDYSLNVKKFAQDFMNIV